MSAQLKVLGYFAGLVFTDLVIVIAALTTRFHDPGYQIAGLGRCGANAPVLSMAYETDQADDKYDESGAAVFPALPLIR